MPVPNHHSRDVSKRDERKTKEIKWMVCLHKKFGSWPPVH
jgi:hypothetical protein